MRPTLQQIFVAGYEAFERTYPLPGYVRRAARAIINCRTEAMGGHIETCPEGDLKGSFTIHAVTECVPNALTCKSNNGF